MKLSLVDTLIDEGLLDERQLTECREIERETGQPLDRVLKMKGIVSEESLLEFLSKSLRLPLRADLDSVDTPKEFVNRVPAQFARNYNLVAVGRQPVTDTVNLEAGYLTFLELKTHVAEAKDELGDAADK